MHISPLQFGVSVGVGHCAQIWTCRVLTDSARRPILSSTNGHVQAAQVPSPAIIAAIIYCVSR